ncbi:hypothetical protein AV530_007480 [Patagioenas fasciata monilis]|uniref:Uncharacterized protein n=1 Tax=Patagioenas fasciata monilis TaxID=372326 RepID=A0A1V4JXY8_PATFA|nr:hypothetical protein AV530_007480 [Patagioenas fasciata monilis]
MILTSDVWGAVIPVSSIHLVNIIWALPPQEKNHSGEEEIAEACCCGGFHVYKRKGREYKLTHSCLQPKLHH